MIKISEIINFILIGLILFLVFCQRPKNEIHNGIDKKEVEYMLQKQKQVIITQLEEKKQDEAKANIQKAKNNINTRSKRDSNRYIIFSRYLHPKY